MLLAGLLEQDGFRRLARHGGGLLRFVLALERHRPGRRQASARGQEGVAQDAEDPGAEIRSRLERAEALQRFGVGLLHQVSRLVPILREPVREIVERIEERHRQFFEAGTGGMRRHSAKY